MSRIGKYPVKIPQGVSASFADSVFSIKGPKGELKRVIPSEVSVSLTPEEIIFSLSDSKTANSPIWGTTTSHVKNMIEGVSKGFEKKLQIEGIGYRGEVKGKEIVFALGFSHPVVVSIPDDLSVTIEKGNITISGIDKEKVGHFAAKIRDYKKPEPYKGKGIRYVGEVIHMKQGKKSV